VITRHPRPRAAAGVPLVDRASAHSATYRRAPESASRPGAGSDGRPSVPIAPGCSAHEALQLFSDSLLEDVPIQREIRDDLFQFGVFVPERSQLAELR
jgi:hypothetical protein